MPALDLSARLTASPALAPGLRLAELSRPENALAGLLTFGVGYVLGGRGSLAALVCGLLVVLLVHSFATIDNDLSDMDVDRANHRTSVLLGGEMRQSWIRLYALGCVGLAVIVAIASPQVRTSLVSLGLLLVLSIAYNHRPVKASRRPMRSIIVLGLVYGAVPMSYGYASGGGRPVWWIAVLVAAWFCMRSSISVLKDFADARGDKAHGKRTFYVVYGKRAVVAVSLTLGILGYGLVFVVLGLLSPNVWFTLGLVCAGAAAGAELGQRRWLSRSDDPEQLAMIFRRCFAIHNGYEAILIACFWLFGR